MTGCGKHGSGMVAALALMATFACSHAPADTLQAGAPSLGQARVPGQYLVTLAQGADAGVISELYGPFGIREVRDLGRGVYLMVLVEDPGPAAVEAVRGKDVRIRAIQPNFRYRSEGTGTIR